jgi:hypothetical protein
MRRSGQHRRASGSLRRLRCRGFGREKLMKRRQKSRFRSPMEFERSAIPATESRDFARMDQAHPRNRQPQKGPTVCARLLPGWSPAKSSHPGYSWRCYGLRKPILREGAEDSFRASCALDPQRVSMSLPRCWSHEHGRSNSVLQRDLQAGCLLRDRHRQSPDPYPTKRRPSQKPGKLEWLAASGVVKRRVQ